MKTGARPHPDKPKADPPKFSARKLKRLQAKSITIESACGNVIRLTPVSVNQWSVECRSDRGTWLSLGWCGVTGWRDWVFESEHVYADGEVPT